MLLQDAWTDSTTQEGADVEPASPPLTLASDQPLALTIAVTIWLSAVPVAHRRVWEAMRRATRCVRVQRNSVLDVETTARRVWLVTAVQSSILERLLSSSLTIWETRGHERLLSESLLTRWSRVALCERRQGLRFRGDVDPSIQPARHTASVAGDCMINIAMTSVSYASLCRLISPLACDPCPVMPTFQRSARRKPRIPSHLPSLECMRRRL